MPLERMMQASTSAFSRTSLPVARLASRRSLTVKAVTWDPEGVFKAPPQQGLIDRKLRNQQIQSDKSYAFQMEKFANEEREARQKKRDARKPPVTPAGMVEYMLETEADEMEYEVARYRPSLDEEFFAYLDKLVGLERLAAKLDEDRLAELETLRDFLKEATTALDATTTSIITGPGERLKKLLGAQDKKAMLLEMAGNNELDAALFQLLETNIEGAKAAKQDQAAEFMSKILTAAKRYSVTS